MEKRNKKALCGADPLEVAAMLCAAAVDKKAENLALLDVRRLSGFTDYFLIMEGRSTRHVQGLAAALDQQLSRKRLSSLKAEGLEEGRWVLLDFDDIVVHIFYHEDRGLYDLEGLWHDAPRLDVARLLGGEKLEAVK